jgi:hypothetical protein
LLNYCRHTGWEELGTSGSDHYRFRKVLPDGTILRTKVSRSLGKEIPAHQFAEILKNQLHATKDEFNRHK